MTREEQRENRNKIRELRAQGLSVKEIAEQLGCSKSTVSLYSRGVNLTEEQIENLNQKQLESSKKGSLARVHNKIIAESSRTYIPLPEVSRVNIGLIGEAYAKYRLARAGLNILIPSVLTLACDVIVEGQSGKFYQCEVKSSRTNKIEFSRTIYNAENKSCPKRGSYEGMGVDMFIAVLLSEERIFIVPSDKYNMYMTFSDTNSNIQWENRFDLFV